MKDRVTQQDVEALTLLEAAVLTTLPDAWSTYSMTLDLLHASILDAVVWEDRYSPLHTLTLRQVRDACRGLRKQGYLDLGFCWDEDTNRLGGSVYFLTGLGNVARTVLMLLPTTSNEEASPQP